MATHRAVEPTLRMELTWDQVGKRWRLTWQLPANRGVISHWRWIETTNSLGALEAHRLADSLTREMESWLPW